MLLCVQKLHHMRHIFFLDIIFTAALKLQQLILDIYDRIFHVPYIFADLRRRFAAVCLDRKSVV